MYARLIRQADAQSAERIADTIFRNHEALKYLKNPICANHLWKQTRL
jgi:hypothetical protein